MLFDRDVNCAPGGAEFRRRRAAAGERYRQVFENSSDALFILDVGRDGKLRFSSLNPAAEAAFGLPAAILKGLSIDEIVGGRLGPSFGAALVEHAECYMSCLATGMPCEYEGALEMLPERRGGRRRFRVQLLPLVGDAGIERIIGIAHDITLRTQYEKELQERARLEQQLSALAAAAPGVLFSLRSRPGGGASFPFVSAGVEELFNLRAEDLREDAGVLHRCCQADGWANVMRLMADAAWWFAPVDAELCAVHPVKGLRWINFRATPQLQSDGTTEWHGFMIDVTARKEVERCLLESRATLQAFSLRREEAREEERRRIARDLHEELGQVLTALRMQISMLPLRFGDAMPGMRDTTDLMLALVDRTIHGMRDVIASLRPAALDAGIVAALEWLACEFGRHNGIACRLYLPEAAVHLDDAHATAMFRIVQEALTNVARHAGARSVEISLAREEGGWRLQVRDDGRGLGARPRGAARSFGLLNMSERALMIGGKVDIAGLPEGGTMVTLRFPAP